MKLFILMFFLYKTAHTAYAPVEGKVPLELQHIITTLQTNELHSIHHQEINRLIPQIDSAFSSLDGEDVGLIVKSEIYRTLLKHPPSSKRALNSLSPDMGRELLALSKRLSSPFISWLALAVHADLNKLLLSPRLPSFKKKIQSSSSTQWSRTEALMKKKLSLLLPWHHYLTATPENRLEEKIYPLLLRCLREIHFKSTRYASLASVRPPSRGGYFKKVIPEQKKDSLDSLLDPILKQKQAVELPKPVDDWVPKEDDYTQKLPIPTNDWLPEPVDDWKL